MKEFKVPTEALDRIIAAHDKLRQDENDYSKTFGLVAESLEIPAGELKIDFKTGIISVVKEDLDASEAMEDEIAEAIEEEAGA